MCCSTPEGMVKLNDSAGEILAGRWPPRRGGHRRDAARAFPEVPGIDEDILAFLEVAHAQFWIELQ